MAQYNPYHFVPVKGRTKDPKDQFGQLEGPTKSIRAGGHRVTQERYLPNMLSGRLRCVLTTSTPTVVGGEQSRVGSAAAKVGWLLVDGRPVLAGSSLRGMLGAVLESASNSALRILDKKPYEVRVPEGTHPNGRRMVPGPNGLPATAWDFFRAIDPRLLPLQTGDTRRVSIAELLLGVVEENEGEDNRGGFALRSRVRISDAALLGEQTALEPEETLRILGSPKPSTVEAPSSQLANVASPCPVMYMKNAEGQSSYITKAELTPGAHIPQGRKFYLNQQIPVDGRPWRTAEAHANESLNQKNAVQTLPAGAQFRFTVDFDNLHPVELGLVLYSLVPTANYQHKLGMGKPLGLGSLRIAIEKQWGVPRAERYTLAGLRDGQRYRDGSGVWFPRLRDGVRAKLDPEIRQALEAIGEQAKPSAEVHSPLAPGQTDAEHQTFKFFVENQKPFNRRHWLKAISETGGKIEPLVR